MFMLFNIKVYCLQCSLVCCVQIALKNDSLSHLFWGKDWEKEFPHIFLWRQLKWKDRRYNRILSKWKKMMK